MVEIFGDTFHQPTSLPRIVNFAQVSIRRKQNDTATRNSTYRLQHHFANFKDNRPIVPYLVTQVQKSTILEALRHNVDTEIRLRELLAVLDRRVKLYFV